MEDKNPSTGLDRGLVDHVRAIAMVKSRAGRNPRKVYTAYKSATDNSLPAVDDSCIRICAGTLSAKHVQTIKTEPRTPMKSVL